MSDKDVSDIDPNEPGGHEDKDNSKDTVKYDTYKRTLSQLKKEQEERKSLADKLSEYEEKEREAEEKRLKDEGQYQQLLERERKKREELEAKAKENEQNFVNVHKLSAFREKLPGKVKNSAYYDFVDVDAIIVNPETGVIDPDSLDEAVNKFVEEHSALIDTGRVADLPSDAPSNGGGDRLTYEKWRKLPPKERKTRFQEMRRNDLHK